jgi:hypothetical protein
MGLFARAITLSLALLLAVGPAGAGAIIPGKDEPAFRQALSDWLADDEAAALPALGTLADEGNTAAQVLLALIDKSPDLQGPWLSSRTREDRIAMMRAPGGLSGQSFMRHAAEVLPVAKLWVALWDMEAAPELISDFAALGEHRAARESVLTMVAREQSGIASLADDPDYPKALRYYIWREWLGSPDHLPGLAEEIGGLHAGDPQRILSGEAVAPDALADWLMTAVEALPVRALCEARCPDTARSCVLALTDALGGPVRVMALGSPVESLIPARVFSDSPRGHAALLRRALLGATARMRPSLLSRTAEADACLGEVLAAEAARY